MTDAALATGELSAQVVRERFATARRNGSASWLWPDIAISEWQKAMAGIAEAAAKMLAGEDRCALDGADAPAIGLAGYVSGMGPLLGFWIESGRLSAAPGVAEILRLHLSHNRARNWRLCERACVAVERLSQAGITPTICKGMHTAFVYYPEPGVRPVADIDIFIPPSAIYSAERVFRDLAYTPIPRRRRPYACDWVLEARREPHTLAYAHRDDPWELDVQASLNRLLRTGVEVELDRLLPTSQLRAWPVSPAARSLSQPLLTLHLAAHLSQVLLNATLLRIVELVLVIRRDSQSGALDWDAFLAGVQTIGGGRLVYPALHFCEQLAPGVVPPHVLAACRADAPAKLRNLLARLSPATATPLGRPHSVRERFMWAADPRDFVAQAMCELGLGRQGQPFRQTVYSCGTKLWALARGRYTR